MDVDLSDEIPVGLKKRPPARGGLPSDAARIWLWATAAFALLGGLFAGVSTADFITHLDRQVHAIHCSFIPGAGSQLGESGCRTVMMSPYSSIFRGLMWGGLPISLLALAVFAYLVYRASEFALRDRITKHETMFLIAATGLPVLMSAIYWFISVSEIGATCKLCIGVYFSSFAAFGSAVLAHGKAAPKDLRSDSSLWIRWFAEGVGYVAVLSLAYVLFAPASDKTLKGCGTLVQRDDPNKIMIPIAGRPNGTPAIAVLDPLCPACKGFDTRLKASGLEDDLDLQAVLFPLDAKCNWMVKESLHSGACMVSEAMLCDTKAAPKILEWAFANQEALREEAKANERKLKD